MRWCRAAAALLALLLLGSVPSLAQTPVTIIGPVTVGNCVKFFSPVQVQDAGTVCGGAAGSVSSVGNFASDTSLTIAGTGTGPWTGNVTAKLNLGNANTWTAPQTFNANDLILGGVTGSTQCLQAGATGIVTGTGSACGAGGGAVSSVSNADGTLTISPTTGAVVASINLAHVNTWSGAQTFSSGITVSSVFTATGLVTLADHATQAANTVIGNATSLSASPTALAMPSCSTAASALNWTTNTGFTCNTSITAAAVPASGLTGTTLASNVVTSSLTTVGTLIGGATGAGFTINFAASTESGILGLANGGTNAALTASNGGIVYSTGSTLAILAGTVTSGQCLLSGSSAAPSWSSCPQTVSSVSNADSTLTISPTTGAVVASLNLAHANTWTVAQTFAGLTASSFTDTGLASGATQCVQASTTGLLSGTGAACGTGSGAVNSVTNADGTLTISPTTGAVVASLALGHANTWTAAQTFNNSDILLLGSSTGATTFASANAGASNFTITFPAATGTVALTANANVASVSNVDGTLTISPTTGAVVASIALTHANTWTAKQTISTAGFALSGNISQAAWTTSGVRYADVAGTLTDTSSSGTVAAAYTNVHGGDTIAASSATTFTNYYSTYEKAPVAGTNVTLTNGWALGADTLKVNGIATITGNLTTNVTGSTQCLQANSSGVVSGFGGACGTLTGTLGPSQGGTGLSSPTAHSLLQTEGASNFTLITAATAGRIVVDQGAAADWIAVAVSGDCTLASSGAITCTKTSGTAFGTFATANAATPPAIGGTTPAAGSFTTLSATGNLTTNVTGGGTQCVQVNNTGVISGAGSGCNAVTSVSNADGTLTISPTTGLVVASIALGHANSWTGVQTFAASGIKLLGSSTGATTFTSANAGASNFTLTMPAVTDTVAVLGTSQTFTATQTFSGTLNVSGTFQIGGTTVALPISLANGGTAAALTASNGGVVYSTGSALAILAGTATASQCLLSGSNAAPSWGSCSGGAAVSSVSNADGTLTISPTTGAVVASIALGHANTWTAKQTISGAGLALSGNISAAAWTTNGVRLTEGAGTLTDTSSSGTVAVAQTSEFGGNTIAASSVTTFTNYYGVYFNNEIAGSNVTLTNKWALGADSAQINGTLNVTGGGLQVGGSAWVPQPQGRLTLVTGTPVYTSNQTAKSQVFYDCYKGGKLVPVYNGTYDVVLPIAGCEISMTMATSGTGVTNTAGVFDVWGVAVAGALAMCVATNGSGGGWASDVTGSNTARGTGYSQLDTTTRSYITNKNAIASCYTGTTNRGSISANQATYLGTLYTTAAGQTGMNFLPAAAAGGNNSVLGLFNAYNRVPMKVVSRDNTSTWTLTSTTWRAANSNANNAVNFVDGLGEGEVWATYHCGAIGVSSFGSVAIGINLNSTTATPGLQAAYGATITTVQAPVMVTGIIFPGLGLNTLNAVEAGQGTNTSTVYGSGFGSGVGQTQGLVARVFM